MTRARTPTLAAGLALIGFALNSILCRMALGDHVIDAWSFTVLRLASGAVVLVLFARIGSRGAPRSSGASLASGIALFAYAAAFSLAYLRLPAGVGALVLFAAVQIAMIGYGIARGERLTAAEWLGLFLALGGLLVLASRSRVAGDVLGLALMASAGIAWGIYSIRGRSSRAPLRANAGNFAWSVPFALVGLLAAHDDAHLSARGVWLALASGALASGLGYSLWYSALPAMAAKRAALVQLLVPVLAAVAGVLLLREQVTPRLATAAALILGGVGLAIARRGTRSPTRAVAPERDP